MRGGSVAGKELSSSNCGVVPSVTVNKPSYFSGHVLPHKNHREPRQVLAHSFDRGKQKIGDLKLL